MKEMTGAGIIIDTCGVVKAGEKVVIASDQEKIDIADIIAKACLERNIEPLIISMTPRKNHGEEPPAPYTAALKEADIVFAVTSFSLFHTNARIEVCKKGVRWVNLPEFSRQMLREGGWRRYPWKNPRPRVEQTRGRERRRIRGIKTGPQRPA